MKGNYSGKSHAHKDMKKESKKNPEEDACYNCIFLWKNNVFTRNAECYDENGTKCCKHVRCK